MWEIFLHFVAGRRSQNMLIFKIKIVFVPERAECPNWWGRRLGDFDPRTKVFVQLEQLPTEWHCQRCEPFPQWFPNLEIKIWQEIEHFAVLKCVIWIMVFWKQMAECRNVSRLEMSWIRLDQDCRKFWYSEKANSFDITSKLRQKIGDCFQKFIAFSEYLNFTNSCYIMRNSKRLILNRR